MVRFANKLKVVKRSLEKCNKNVFGKVDQRVKQAEGKVLEMEVTFVNDPSEGNKVLLCKPKQKLDNKLQIEEIYWRQKLISNGSRKEIKTLSSSTNLSHTGGRSYTFTK